MLKLYILLIAVGIMSTYEKDFTFAVILVLYICAQLWERRKMHAKGAD